MQRGLFSASDWSNALGGALRDADSRGEPDTQQTYYACVLAALEELVAANSEIDRDAMRAMRGDWEAAYRRTPHGQPVKLKPG